MKLTTVEPGHLGTKKCPDYPGQFDKAPFGTIIKYVD